MPNVSEIFQNFDANIPSRFEQISFKKKNRRIESSGIFNLVMEGLIGTCFGFNFKRAKKGKISLKLKRVRPQESRELL